jgi:predicted RNA-binding protein with PIN domain
MKRVLLLDGYNLLHRDAALRHRLGSDPGAARQVLVNRCRQWLRQRRDADELWLVFDGAEPAGTAPAPTFGVKVAYTGTGVSADDRIAGIVTASDRSRRFTVVTDDAGLAARVRAGGAPVMSVAAFFDVLARDTRHAKAPAAAPPGDKPDLPPAERKALNDELLEAWGSHPASTGRDQ